MKTRLTERGALQAAFNLWDDMAKHGYREKEKSEYSEAANFNGKCILCVYYGLKCDDCVLGKDPEGKFWDCFIYPNHPYILWDNAIISEEKSLHAGTIAALIKKRLDEVTAAEEGNHA
jgi:hypothetical protein